MRVEPDPESERADEDARTPVLKSMLPTMFPSMAAGIEKFETEMARIRRERFGGLFQSAADQRAADQADPADRSRTGGR